MPRSEVSAIREFCPPSSTYIMMNLLLAGGPQPQDNSFKRYDNEDEETIYFAKEKETCGAAH